MILQPYEDVPGRLLCGQGVFLERISDLLASRGEPKKREEKNTPLTCTQQQLWLMFTVNIRKYYTVVAEVGVADGSRVKYDVGS